MIPSVSTTTQRKQPNKKGARGATHQPLLHHPPLPPRQHHQALTRHTLNRTPTLGHNQHLPLPTSPIPTRPPPPQKPTSRKLLDKLPPLTIQVQRDLVTHGHGFRRVPPHGRVVAADLVGADAARGRAVKVVAHEPADAGRAGVGARWVRVDGEEGFFGGALFVHRQ
jgi:hypothetical protein